MHIQVGAQTETELKEKKLRVEDALNATKVLFGTIFSAPKASWIFFAYYFWFILVLDLIHFFPFTGSC